MNKYTLTIILLFMTSVLLFSASNKENYDNLGSGIYPASVNNVSFNEPHFTGHFPDFPVMPGVLIIEAMAQVSAVLVAKTINAKAGEKTVFFMTIDNTKFRQVVQPGDALHIYAKIEQNRGDVWKFSAEAKVDGKVVAESSFSAMVRDR